MPMSWFEVDKDGLAKLLERRGKAWVLYELIQNAWDQNVTKVRVSLVKNGRYATVNVEDDDPEGFADLAHSFTLFADSAKKTDANKRGRFNLGEKLVLALCDEAEILTTTGGVRFDSEGRHQLRRKRNAGSLFVGRLKMTHTEYQECIEAVERLIPPANIETTFFAGLDNPPGVLDEYMVLAVRNAVARFDATLATEIADAEGILRRSARKTSVAVYEADDGVGWLYEMGIPVVETGDTFHVDIGQKVPLNLDRDNVTPAYLRDVRTLVLNAVHDRITDSETANASWVRDALKDENVATDAVRAMVKLRFGEKAVAFDPRDSEANRRAVSEGYVVVHGSQMRKEEWANIRRADVLPAAGRILPTPSAYSDDPDAPMVKIIPEAEWSEAERRVIGAAKRVGCALMGFTPAVRVVLVDNFAAAYGGRQLDLNRRKLGRNWFAECLIEGRLTVAVIDLLIHEFGHEYCGDHLSNKYYEALTRLGAKLVHLVADDSTLLVV